MSLTKRGNVWHFAFRWNGKRYSGKLQDLEAAGSQESGVAGACAVTGRRSRTGK